MWLGSKHIENSPRTQRFMIKMKMFNNIIPTKAMETYSNFANIFLLASSMMKKPIVKSIDI
jgi:hypothetical protein